MKKFLIYYFLFLILFLSLICSGVMDSQDGFQYLAVARNIYYTNKPTAPVDEYKAGKNIHMTTYIGKDGDTYSTTGLGYSLALLPVVAVTDIIYKIYHVQPPIHFPLENDWLILLMGSLTNIFFAAGLGIILFLYFIELKLSKKQSFIMSLVSVFATNLFVFAKNSFAHMMLTMFLVLSFFLLKKFSTARKKILLILAGLSYGVVVITYNGSYLLTIPPLLIYFIILEKMELKNKKFISLFKHLLYFFLGLLPFLVINVWFENLRSTQQADPGWYLQYAKRTFFHVPISVFFEGLWGQLLSPGRSIFIYSPVLLIIIFFWHKLRKEIIPELTVFLLMSLLYITFYAMQVTWGDGGKLGSYGYTGLWHGESSWGPRYLVLLIPFGLLVIGNIFQRLNKFQKYLIFYPLVIIGFYIELLGIVMPYQIKVYNLERNFYVNKTEFTNFVYTDLIPRYTPILSMSKNLIKLALLFPKTLNHGLYNARLYDGINLPFNVGPERWRVIEQKGHISFDNSKKNPIRDITFGLINHPISISSSSARLQFNLNGHPLLNKATVFAVRERNIVRLPIAPQYLKEKDNQLQIDVNFDPPIKDTAQIFSIISFSINNHVVNLESLDLPYYSALGPVMVNAHYQTYGKQITDPWRFWDLHTQVYERTPDFWWIKSMYYWDYPQKAIRFIVVLIVSGVLFFAFKAIHYIKNSE